MTSSTQSIDMFVEAKRGNGALSISRAISPKAQWRLLIAGLILNDIIMVGLAFRLAFFLRFETNLEVFHIEVAPDIVFYQNLVTILIPFWLLVYALNGLYNRQNLLGGTTEYANLFGATTIGMMMVIVFSFFEPDFVLSRGWLLMAWVLAFLMTAGSRFIIRRVVYGFRKRGYFLTPALIAGANEEGRLLAEQLQRWPTSGLFVLGFVDQHASAGTPVLPKINVLGGIEAIDMLIEEYNVGELVLSTSAFRREEMLEIFKRYGVSEKVNLRLSSGLFEIITTGLQVKELGYVPFVSVNKVRLTGLDRLLKLILDYTIMITGLILIAPFLLAIAIAIGLTSPGPVIYRRRVMGVNGKQFDAYKFRTMYVNGDEILAQHPYLMEELAQNHKLKNDPRITPIGGILRKLSLDELPQLLNVLKRDMSLVGPRMISPEEMANYNHWGINLLTVQPGITGLWQVSGRSDISYQERVRLDMQYIRNWTIWLDLQLLVQTIPAVFKGRGAY